MWTIWKERNSRIIKDHSSPIEVLWINICQNIRETLMLQTWLDDDFPSTPQEQNIWLNWNLQWNHEQVHLRKIPPSGDTPDKWTPPPPHIVLLNFDGASKGNLGKAGFGGIFRNHKGNVLQTFMGSIGWDTNNSVELEGILQGLLLAKNNRFFPLIIEGDSQILINMINQILQGTLAHKVGSST